jgi:hypothetical protein
MSIANYLSLDLSRGGETLSRLREHLQREGATPPPQLTLSAEGQAGAASANLTPGMIQWFSANIEPVRLAALNELESEAARISLPGGIHGIVPEIEDCKLKRDRTERSAAVYETFYNRHGAELNDLSRREQEYQAIRGEEGGREPRNPGRFLDMIIPLGIMIPEGLMNYRYFLDYVQWGVIALGSTIVVGLAIGWSAYIAGRFWKAFHFYMPPDDDKQRQKGKRMLTTAVVLLTVALLAVGAVRYFGVMQQIQRAIALGEIPPNPFMQTAFLLFGNLLVFALGLAITYWLHDENPLYAEKAETYARQKAKVDRLRMGFVKKVNEIDIAYKQKGDKMRNQGRLMNGKPGYGDIREKLRNIDAKDAEVVGMLQAYRSELAHKLPADYKFSPPTLRTSLAQTTAAIDLSTFAALPIDLLRC